MQIARGSSGTAASAVTAQAGIYNRNVGAVVEAGVRDVNWHGARWRNHSDPAVRTGHVVEADHVATANVDASFRASKVKAVHVRSNGIKSSDIDIIGEDGRTLLQVQSKVYKTAEQTAKKQRGYGDQVRLTPKDQTDAARQHARKMALKESAKRANVAAEWAEVEAKTVDRISVEGMESAPRTRQESREIAEKARSKAVTGADIVGEIGQRARQGARTGMRSGFVVGAATSAVGGAINGIGCYAKGEMTAGEAALHVGRRTATGTVDAMIKGAASGAATAAARVLAERAGSQIAKRALGGSAPAAAAMFACDAAYGAIEVALGRRSWTEFGEGVAASAKAGAVGVAGFEIGFLVGGPIGAAIGGICLPLVLGFAARWFATVETDGQPIDTARIAEAAHDPAVVAAALIALAAQCRGLDADRLLQLGRLFEMLSRAEARIFPGRVALGRGDYQTSADVVVAHEGRVFAVDLRLWKGRISPIGAARSTIPPKVLKRKERADGLVDHQTFRNPLLGPAEFAMTARDRLVGDEARWSMTAIEPIVVFPGEVELLGSLGSDGRMSSVEGLEKRLRAGDGRATPAWMLESLARLPSWDSVGFADGGMLQGLLEKETLNVAFVDGALDVPLASVAKVDIDPYATGDPNISAVTILLRDATTLAGVLGPQEVVINRKGSRTQHQISDIRVIRPGDFVLT